MEPVVGGDAEAAAMTEGSQDERPRWGNDEGDQDEKITKKTETKKGKATTYLSELTGAWRDVLDPTVVCRGSAVPLGPAAGRLSRGVR